MRKSLKKNTDTSYVEILNSRNDKQSASYIKKSIDFAKFIEEFKNSPDFRQRDIGEKLNINESQISRWLSGFHNLTIKSILKLESVCNIQILNPAMFEGGKGNVNDHIYTTIVEEKQVTEPFPYENFKCVWSNGDFKQDVKQEMAVVIEIKSLSDLPKEAESYG